MPRVPAVCDNCGSIFPSGIELKNSIGMRFVGAGAGPCPKCKGMGTILDGVYDALGDTLNILVESKESAAQLQALLDALKAKDKEATSEEIEQTVRETAPAFPSLARLFSQKNRLELWAILAIVIAWLTYVQEHPNSPPTETTTVNIVNNCMVATSPSNRLARRTAKSRARHK